MLSSLATRRLLAADFEPCRLEAERAVAAARAAGASAQEAYSLITLGAARAYLGDGDEGVRVVRAGLDLSEAEANPTNLVRGHLILSDVLESLGRSGEAVDTAGRGLALAQRAG